MIAVWWRLQVPLQGGEGLGLHLHGEEPSQLSLRQGRGGMHAGRRVAA